MCARRRRQQLSESEGKVKKDIAKLAKKALNDAARADGSLARARSAAAAKADK